MSGIEVNCHDIIPIPRSLISEVDGLSEHKGSGPAAGVAYFMRKSSRVNNLLENSIRYIWESFITLQFINITSCVNPKCVNTLILRYGTLCMKLIVIFRIHRIFNAEFERHILIRVADV